MDRFDIAEAHLVLEWDYNLGGWLRERPSNLRRMEATSMQISRIKFVPRADLSFETLTDEGKEVYLTNVLRWKLPTDAQQRTLIRDRFVPEFIRQHSHPDFADAPRARDGA